MGKQDLQIRVTSKLQFVRKVIGCYKQLLKQQLSDKELLLYSCVITELSVNQAISTPELREKAKRLSKIPVGQISTLLDRIVQKKYLKLENNHYIAPAGFLAAVRKYPRFTIEISSDGID